MKIVFIITLNCNLPQMPIYSTVNKKIVLTSHNDFNNKNAESTLYATVGVKFIIIIMSERR